MKVPRLKRGVGASERCEHEEGDEDNASIESGHDPQSCTCHANSIRRAAQPRVKTPRRFDESGAGFERLNAFVGRVIAVIGCDVRN
jgi:hypothetical protein